MAQAHLPAPSCDLKGRSQCKRRPEECLPLPVVVCLGLHGFYPSVTPAKLSWLSRDFVVGQCLIASLSKEKKCAERVDKRASRRGIFS